MEQRDQKEGRTVQQVDWSVVVVVGLVVLVTSLHYTTPVRYPHLHELFRRLYYLPIIIAAFRYGINGGVISSIAVSLIYFPHIAFQWKGAFLDNLVRLNEIVMYLVVGTIAGFLSGKVQNERDRYKRTAEQLKVSYNKLESQALLLSGIESQLRAADRMAVLGELSASLAHEVRNPLGSIKGAVDILSKRCRQDVTAQEFSDILRKEVDRLNSVVESYLNLAHKPSKIKGISDVRDIAESVSALVSPEIRKRNIRLFHDFSDYPLRIKMSGIELQQVFLNLVLNALAALNDGGSIHIQGEKRDEQIVIKVADSGKGIPADQLINIFKPFYTNKENGTGLGLAIVERIVESGDGVIKVESREGKGTTFTIIFNQAE